MFLIIALILSVAVNIVLIWYVRKVVQMMAYGIENVEELQKLLNEYAGLLEPVATMENYYGDPAITSAVANTKLVIDACRIYKQTLIRNHDEEDTEEGFEEQEAPRQEESPKAPRKAQAKISPIKTQRNN